MDYYFFGMQMGGRTFSGGDYRYGFNGMEKDDEVAGSGNSYTAEFWQYDSRLGRRWNRDPVIKPWESPYAVFSNNPIKFADPRGLNAEDKVPQMPENPTDKQKYRYIDKKLNIHRWQYVQNGDGGFWEYQGSKGLLKAMLDGMRTSGYSSKWISKAWGAIVDAVKQMDRNLERDDSHTDRPPVQTDLHGFIQMGSGPNRNVNIYGDPEFSDSGYNPGSIAGGVGWETPRGQKDIDDWDDLFDEDGAELFKQLSQTPELINSVVEEFNKNLDSDPALGKSTSKSVQKSVESIQQQALGNFLVKLPDGRYARFIKDTNSNVYKGDTIGAPQADVIHNRDKMPIFDSIPNGVKTIGYGY